MREKIMQYVSGRWGKVISVFILSRIIYGIIIWFSNCSVTELCTLCDNEHYISIAQNGYTEDWQTAFFPLIPFIIRFIGTKGMLMINQIAFLLSMFLLDSLTDKKDNFVLKLFGLSVISFFSMMFYTETLLCFFTVLGYYLFTKRHFGFGMGIVIGLCVATKSIGAMLFFAIFIGMCCLWYQKQLRLMDILKTYIPATIISCLYPMYLQMTFGNWKLFVDCQYSSWRRLQTNLLQELWIQLNFICSSERRIYKINEILTLFMTCCILYGLYYLLRTYKKKGMDMVNMLVLVLYTVFAILAINSTIRIPIDNAPTTSFYRYYYSLFTIYLLAAQLEGTKRQVVYYCSIGISFMAAVLFSKNFYFY